MKIYVKSEDGRKSTIDVDESMTISELRDFVARRWDDLDKLNQRIEIMPVADGVGDILDVVGTDYHWTGLLPGLNSSPEYSKRKTPPAACSSPTKKTMQNTQPQNASMWKRNEERILNQIAQSRNQTTEVRRDDDRAGRVGFPRSSARGKRYERSECGHRDSGRNSRGKSAVSERESPREDVSMAKENTSRETMERGRSDKRNDKDRRIGAR